MGRPKTFTVASALDEAVALFRQRGLQDTSMQSLAKRLGLSRASIYATFGDKRRLFVESLHHYGPSFRGPGLRQLAESESPRAALVAVFELTITRATEGQQHAPCLLINTAMDVLPRVDATAKVVQILQRALLDLETRFCHAIERANTTGEIATGVDPVQTARALLALYLGLWVLIRCGAGEPILRTVAQQARLLLPTRDQGP